MCWWDNETTMKIKEAKKIVGYIMAWQFVLMGVKERSEIIESIKDFDIKKYSLLDLICEEIGTAKEGTKKGLILASFNAG